MKFIGFLLILSLLTISSCGIKISDNGLNPNTIRPSSTFDHISHIRKESQKNPLYLRNLYKDSTQPKYFVDYVIKNLLKKPEHEKYITDRKLLRKLLRKLKNNTCWENYVLIKDTLSNGNKCEIEIKTQNFDHKTHKLEYNKESNFLTSIDKKVSIRSYIHEIPNRRNKIINYKNKRRRTKYRPKRIWKLIQSQSL